MGFSVRALLADRGLVPRAFDRAARRYDRLTSMNPGYDEHLRISARRLDAPPRARLLDLCCGTGRSTAALLAACPQASVVGVDASAGMLDQARRAIGGGASGGTAALIRADALTPGLRRGSFDAVFIAYGLRNMGDPDGCLEAIFELLRPGGRLAVHDYALTDLRSRLTWAAVCHFVIIPAGLVLTGSAALYRYLYRSVVAFDRADELAARLRAHGFVDVARRDLTHWQKGITHTFTARRPEAP